MATKNIQKKKSERIIGDMYENGELIAVKANKFVQEYKVSLSLAEIRIVNYLIAHIESPQYDKKFRKFKFEIKEFCDAVYPDVKQGDAYKRLPETIQALSDKSAWKEVPSTDNPGKMKKVLIRWIERPEFDEGYVIIELNPYLAPYLLQLDKGFIKSKFQYTILAQSKYTIPLYELLKSWELVRGHKKRFELGELRAYMDAMEKSKNNVAEFKRRALDPAVKEINDFTDLQVSYTQIKRGRRVTEIDFTILPKRMLTGSQVPGQTEFRDAQTFDSYMNEAFGEADQLHDVDVIVRMMAKKRITKLDALKIYDAARGDMELIAKVYEYCKGKKIDNFVAYMLRLVSPGEFKEPIKNSAKNNFSNFEGRSYDYDDLESQFLRAPAPRRED